VALMPTPFLLSLGSNLEPRVERLHDAIALLTSELGPLVVSAMYETSPVGYTDQPDFVNCCVTGVTTKTAHELYNLCTSVEHRIGRMSRERWREREIDIDVILFGTQQFADATITIPHPRMQDRLFVLVPAAEIAPHMIDPRTGRMIEQVLQGCTDEGTVRILS